MSPESPGYMELVEPPGFHSLQDETIVKIFMHLSLADRVRIERVCKRWLEMATKVGGKLRFRIVK